MSHNELLGLLIGASYNHLIDFKPCMRIPITKRYNFKIRENWSFALSFLFGLMIFEYILFKT